MTMLSESLRRLLGVGIVALSAIAAPTGAASAAELDGVITDIRITPTNARPFDLLRVDLDFCLPDSAAAGDTFGVTLPEQLVDLPNSFVVNAPDGSVVANAAISGVPEVATFTLTDYVDDRVDICGVAFFESQLSGDVTEGSDETLTFVVGGGVTYDKVVTVEPRSAVIGRDESRKGGYFANPGDECRNTVESCLGWYIESRPGPLKSVVISDDGLDSATFDCSQFSVRLRRVNADGTLAGAVAAGDVGATITMSCAPDALDVTVTDVPAEILVRVLVRATPDVPDPDGGTVYTNLASLTYVLADDSVVTDDIRGARKSAEVGGSAVGVTPSTTTSSTLAPTTTAATDTTTSVAPTSTVEVLPPVPTSTTSTTVPTTNTLAPVSSTTTTVPVAAQLPATGGGSGSLAVVALSSVLAGTGLVLSARRRSA